MYIHPNIGNTQSINQKRMGIKMNKIYRMAACIMAGVVLAGAYQYRIQKLQEGLAERILRFHVIANSNTKEDQALKLKVRDEIGAFLKEKLSGAKNLAECEETVNANLDEIELCADTVIAEEGYDYAVNATVHTTNFPKKTYGSYTFPKGEYRALNVVIGDGAGENWWCVMYPNLCFAGSVYEVIEENAKEELRSVLNEEEYAEIMAEGNIKVKFKYLDALLNLFQ